MHNSGWQKARARAGLGQVRVHDLKHTFGRRLRAAGVSFEDRQDLLGHKTGKITTHYSAAKLGGLIEAANKACETKSYTGNAETKIGQSLRHNRLIRNHNMARPAGFEPTTPWSVEVEPTDSLIHLPATLRPSLAPNSRSISTK